MLQNGAFVVCLLAVAAPALAEPSALPEDPAAAWAIARQEQIPAFEARLRSANERSRARRTFFEGKGTLEEAFPRLSGTSLGSAAVLSGRIGQLDDAAVERARERAQAPPDLGDEARESRWRMARDAALDAEAEAHDLQRRLLIGLLAQLRDHPELTDAALRARRTALQDVIEAAEGADVSADPEGARAQQEAAASAATELARLDEVVQGLRLLPFTRVVPDPGPDLARLEEGNAAGAALRLSLLWSFLEGEVRQRVGAAVGAFWSGVPLAEAQADLEAAQAELQQAASLAPEQAAEVADRVASREAALESVRQALAAVPEGDAPALQGRRQVLLKRVEAAETRLQAAQAHVQASQEGVAVSQEAERAKTEAQLAEEQARAAREAADSARDQRLADALTDYAAARARSAKRWEQAEAAQARADDVRKTMVDTVGPIQRKIEQIQELSTLDASRPVPDTVYAEIRTLLGRLRSDDAARGQLLLEAEQIAAASHEAIARDRKRVDTAHSVLEGLDGDERETLEDTMTRWEDVLLSEERAATALVDAANAERDGVLRALHEARIARRTLESYISRRQREQDASFFLEDVYQELSLLGPSIWMMLRGRFHDIVAFPRTLTDFTVLRTLFKGSLWTIAFAVGWWWAHNQSEHWALRVANRARKYRPEVRLADVRALRDPIARFIRSSGDLALGRLLMWSLKETLPEIQFVLLVYLQVALYRALLAGFDLLVIRTTEVRPALLVLRKELYDLARQTVQAAAGYFIVRSFVHYVLWEVLGLDVISSVVATVFWLAFWVLLGWLLYRWEPVLRERIARRNQESRLVSWLARSDTNRLLRIPRAIAILLFFVVAGAVDVFYRLARDGTSLAWLFNAVNRFRISDEEGDAIDLLPEPVLDRITGGQTGVKHNVDRPEIEEVGTVLTEWKRTRRRGLVALVGDRGTGKRTACDRVVEIMEKAELTVLRAELEVHQTDPDAALAWLARLAGLDSQDTADDLVEALHTIEPRGFVLEHIHRTFSRKVGGLDAIAQLLYVLNASSDRHFFVVSVHGPAWDYFSSVGSLVDCGVFHTVIRLAPLTSQQLRELTIGRTGAAGLRVDFSGLARSNALGADPEVEQERATTLFYRLLAEASGGSPTIAMQLWSRCLEPTDDEHVVRVRMGSSLNPGVVKNLSDASLFVLVALHLQDGLPERELTEVTNLSTAAVRATVRDLLSRGLLLRKDGWVQIPDRERPGIQRTLRRRHFLHLGA